MAVTIHLPTLGGSLEPFTLPEPRPVAAIDPGSFPRIAYAAAHIVADPMATVDPWSGGAVDWDATMAFRRHLWSLGFRIAEAMDTAQRGMGCDWATAQMLIRRSIAEARTVPGADLACGAGTDHLDIAAVRTVDEVIRGYEEQLSFIEGLGGRAIMMASRALARVARGPEDYDRVYDRILSQAARPVVLHWLGPMFDPALGGYWGSDAFEKALPVVLGIIERNRAKVEGIKISLLDAAYEIELRRRLPAGVMMFTGDDFNYPDLIAGDDQGHSHALLGIFAAIAPVASEALMLLGQGDRAGYDRLMAPTVPLSRRIFEAPTQYYKAGIVFLAWLNGHQSHFTMLGGVQSARSIRHFSDVFRLAGNAGLLADPDLAVSRIKGLLKIYGVTP